MNNELTQKLLQLYINRDAPKSMIYPIPTEWDNKKWIGATEGHHFILIEENEENKVETNSSTKTVSTPIVVQPTSSYQSTNSAGIADPEIKADLEKLKLKVCSRARSFLMVKMNNLRKPKTNFQIL